MQYSAISFFGFISPAGHKVTSNASPVHDKMIFDGLLSGRLGAVLCSSAHA